MVYDCQSPLRDFELASRSALGALPRAKSEPSLRRGNFLVTMTQADMVVKAM